MPEPKPLTITKKKPTVKKKPGLTITSTGIQPNPNPNNKVKLEQTGDDEDPKKKKEPEKKQQAAPKQTGSSGQQSSWYGLGKNAALAIVSVVNLLGAGTGKVGQGIAQVVAHPKLAAKVLGKAALGLGATVPALVLGGIGGSIKGGIKSFRKGKGFKIGFITGGIEAVKVVLSTSVKAFKDIPKDFVKAKNASHTKNAKKYLSPEETAARATDKHKTSKRKVFDKGRKKLHKAEGAMLKKVKQYVNADAMKSKYRESLKTGVAGINTRVANIKGQSEDSINQIRANNELSPKEKGAKIKTVRQEERTALQKLSGSGLDAVIKQANEVISGYSSGQNNGNKDVQPNPNEMTGHHNLNANKLKKLSQLVPKQDNQNTNVSENDNRNTSRNANMF